MPGPLTRPPNMRDVLYNYNWRIGYTLIPVTIAVWTWGFFFIKRRRARYDAFFEKARDPAYRKLIDEKCDTQPEKYVALIARLKADIRPVKEKYGINDWS